MKMETLERANELATSIKQIGVFRQKALYRAGVDEITLAELRDAIDAVLDKREQELVREVEEL